MLFCKRSFIVKKSARAGRGAFLVPEVMAECGNVVGAPR